MFGFGRKKTVASPELIDFAARHPGVFHGSTETTVWELAIDLACLVHVRFNTVFFDAIIEESKLPLKAFADGWTRSDALSRWHALGLICLFHCSALKPWHDALKVNGKEVYYAAVEACFMMWTSSAANANYLSEETVRKTVLFMQTNNDNLETSLRAIVDKKTNQMWIRRYAERIQGRDPSWDIVESYENQNEMEEIYVRKHGTGMFCHLLTSCVKDVSESILQRVIKV